jgi:arsenate reductase (thioredoxin)
MARPVVLYACVHNSGRSVAALALTRHLYGDRLDARSAGSEPGDGVNPVVAAVLAERGIGVSDHRPALLTLEGVREADVVVTMGCGESCPYVPGKHYEDWVLEDPKGKDVAVVRRIVGETEQRVHDLAERLTTIGGC